MSDKRDTRKNVSSRMKREGKSDVRSRDDNGEWPALGSLSVCDGCLGDGWTVAREAVLRAEQRPTSAEAARRAMRRVLST